MAVIFAWLVGFIFAPWLRPYEQPQRGGPDLPIRAGDLTPLFSVWTQVAARSLFQQGEFPLWSDHIYCGEPFFAKPQIGVISLTTLLCLVLPAQAAATWTFLLHLWMAGMAMYGWCIVMLRSTPTVFPASGGSHPLPSLGRPGKHDPIDLFLPAACGGLCFMLSALMIEHTMIGHGPIVLVACFTPLVLGLLYYAYSSSQPIRFAVLAGTVVAIQLLAGGETVFLHNVVAGIIVSLAWVVGYHAVSSPTVPSGSMSWIGRAARVTAAGTCVGLVGLGLSAVKVLPGLELMGVTNRAGGLSLEDASGFIREFTEPALFRLPSDGLRAIGEAKYLFPVTITVAGVGLIVGLYQRATRWLALAGLLLVVSGIAIAHSKFVFGLLWHVMPMFRFQRIPQRALVLAYLGLGLLVSIGARQIVSMLPRAGLAAGSGVVLMLAIAGECLYSHPPLPPTADIRQEVKENQILNHLAKEPGRFRIHAVESADRNWGIEHVTVPLGLSNLAGWDHLWLLEYLGAEGVLGRDVPPFLAVSYESRNPARFWGLMNVRFITATRLIQASSLRLVGEFPVSPRCQPRKSAGPYLYENLEFMPRAWLAPQAILVLGDRSQRQQAAYQLMDHPSFDPHRVAVIQSDHSEQWIDEFSDYNAVILPRSWLTEQGGMDELEPHKLLSYDAEGGDRRRRFQWTRPQEVTRVLDELAVSGTSVGQDVAVHSARSTMGLAISPSGYARLELPGRAGFLVLAEKIARFPGWRATTDAGPRELLHANGVASAVRLDGSESVIEFRYRPAGLVTGLCISIVSLVIAPVLYWLGNQFVARWRQ